MKSPPAGRLRRATNPSSPAQHYFQKLTYNQLPFTFRTQRKKKGSRGGRPVSHDTALYKERNTVEGLINKLKAWRGIATRYDKTPKSYLAGVHLRGSMIWIKELARATP